MNPVPNKVKVLVRVRPFLLHEEEEDLCAMVDGNNLVLQHPRFDSLSFQLDGCYPPDTTQDVLFKSEIEPLLESVFNGINTTAFTYGVTNSGKTFTMQGTDSQPGLIPKSIDTIIKLSHNFDEISIFVSYLEIYNEKVYDLLSPNSHSVDLQIREDHNKKIFIQGLSEIKINTVEDFQIVYCNGCKNRVTGSTKLNSSSSRSHAVLVIKVERVDSIKKITFRGKLQLIDLAGSEDNRISGNKGMRLIESSSINNSLFVLKNVVNGLNKGDSRIPYRDSKLTRLLQDSLGGGSQSILCVNIAPGIRFYTDSAKTLEFASKSRQIINKPKIHNVENVIETQDDRRKLLEMYQQKKKLKMGEQKTQSSSCTIVSSDENKENDGSNNVNQEVCFIKEQVAETRALVEELKNMVGDAKNKKVAPLTPFTKSTEIKALLFKAKSYKKVKRYDDARRCYEQVSDLVSEKELKLKLEKKILSLQSLTHNDSFSPSIQKTSPIRTWNVDDKYESEPENPENEYYIDAVENENDKEKKNQKEDEKRFSQNGSFEENRSERFDVMEITKPDFSQSDQISKTIEKLNYGDKKALLSLAGIGNKKVDMLLKYRMSDDFRPFESIDDLKRVVGFGDRLIQNLKKQSGY